MYHYGYKDIVELEKTMESEKQTKAAIEYINRDSYTANA